MALAVVNSLLNGGTLGLAVQAGTGALPASAPWVITGTGTLAGNLARQRATWRAARQASVSATASR